MCKNFFNVLLVILAAKTQENARVVQITHKALKGQPGRVETDPFCTVFSTNPGPKGLVAIKRYDFAGWAVKSMEFAHYCSSQGSEENGRIWNVPQFFPTG